MLLAPVVCAAAGRVAVATDGVGFCPAGRLLGAETRDVRSVSRES
ncbi:hypothetical protein SynMVIR181_00981 [Synechococcus sp. MVIR-18-1]|nr:hypothetical protein SynMVIR181_00981 [Synechococcus sp. MVIR-18-1]